MSDCIYIVGDSNYLMHHGIKGQKWGVENGPPYPLNPSKDYSSAEKKLNKVMSKTQERADIVKRGTENYDRRKNVYDLINKSHYEKKFDKEIEKTNKQIQKISQKYKNDNDIQDMIKESQKAVDGLVSDIGSIRLTPEMTQAARKYERALRLSFVGGGVIGTAIATAGTQKALDTRTGDKSSAYKWAEQKTAQGINKVNDWAEQKRNS